MIDNEFRRFCMEKTSLTFQSPSSQDCILFNRSISTNNLPMNVPLTQYSLFVSRFHGLEALFRSDQRSNSNDSFFSWHDSCIPDLQSLQVIVLFLGSISTLREPRQVKLWPALSYINLQ
jgi:hypothetical protein